MIRVELLLLILIFASPACLKLEETPVQNSGFPVNPYSNTFGCYQFWPKRQDKKWIFDVFKVKNGNDIFIYQDTLIYAGDTNIYSSGIHYFLRFRFIHAPYKLQFIVGDYLPNKLSYYINGVSYDAFDLDSMSLNKNVIYSYDGSPFDKRYTVSYLSPYLDKFKTAIGEFTAISSNIKYDWTSFAGQRTVIQQQLYLAKDKGLVEYMFNYTSYNNLNVRDSSLSLIYKINKIIH